MSYCGDLVTKDGKTMVRIKTKKTEDSPYSIGARLRKAREDKGISLEDAHKATKIHPNVIEALEEDRLEHVLGMTYVKSFLKKYAQFLGLDEVGMIREYTSTFVPQAKEGPILEKKTISERKLKFSHKLITLFIFITWISIMSLATARFINHYKDSAKGKEVAAAAAVKKVESEEKLTEKGIIPIPKDRPIILILTTNKDVWIKVTRDNDLAFHGILPKDSKETWQANEEIRVSEIGKPEALTLNVNGKSIDFSKSPLKKEILITHEGVNLDPKP